RPNRTRSYCVPLIVKAADRMQLVVSGRKCVASYEPDTGKQTGLIGGATEQFVSSLVYGDGVLFLTAGFPTYHLMGIRPDGVGNVPTRLCSGTTSTRAITCRRRSGPAHL